MLKFLTSMMSRQGQSDCSLFQLFLIHRWQRLDILQTLQSLNKVILMEFTILKLINLLSCHIVKVIAIILHIRSLLLIFLLSIS